MLCEISQEQKGKYCMISNYRNKVKLWSLKAEGQREDCRDIGQRI